MSRFFRQIALLMMLVFTANVQCWASGFGDEMTHEQSENHAVVMGQSTPDHPDNKDCNLAGHHCCHALSHLLGQVADNFSVFPPSVSIKRISSADEDAKSLTPESIYHPPRRPSLT